MPRSTKNRARSVKTKTVKSTPPQQTWLACASKKANYCTNYCQQVACACTSAVCKHKKKLFLAAIVSSSFYGLYHYLKNHTCTLSCDNSCSSSSSSSCDTISDTVCDDSSFSSSSSSSSSSSTSSESESSSCSSDSSSGDEEGVNKNIIVIINETKDSQQANQQAVNSQKKSTKSYVLNDPNDLCVLKECLPQSILDQLNL